MTRASTGFAGLGAYCPSNLIGPAPAPPAVPPTVDPLFVSELIGALGRADFPVRFAQACHGLFGALQTTAFSLDGRGAACFFAQKRDGNPLPIDPERFFALQYEARDPFLDPRPDGDEAPYRDAVIRRAEVRDAGYRERMFVAAGAEAKVAIAFRRNARRLLFNCYVRSRPGVGLTDVLATWRDHRAILSETLLAYGRTLADEPARDDIAAVERALRQRFPVLSPREAEVCARTAAGASVDAIAHDLAISPATVATFRRRAYAKVGVASQKELFARFTTRLLPPGTLAIEP